MSYYQKGELNKSVVDEIDRRGTRDKCKCTGVTRKKVGIREGKYRTKCERSVSDFRIHCVTYLGRGKFF